MDIEIIMPSAGDMEIVSQEGGSIKLRPRFYGGECMGPVVVVSDEDEEQARYRVKVKKDGRVELKKGD